MDSVKIWNRIVKHYKDNYSAKEEVPQRDWEQIFSDLLNYSRFLARSIRTEAFILDLISEQYQTL